VDAKGEVRGVLVAGFDGFELRWGIPSEYAARMVDGYPLEILPGRAYLDGSVPKQPVQIRFSDPLGQLKEVAIDFWVGERGKARKASDVAPKPAPGDGPRQSAKLSLKPGDWPGERLAAGEFVLPDVPQGRVCWLQPRFTNATGKEQWSRAVPYAPDGPPVERKPTELAVKFKKGSHRDLELTTFTNIYTKELGRGKREGFPFKVAMTEHVLQTTKQGGATINLEYQGLEVDFKKIFPELDEAPPQVNAVLNQRIKPLLSLIRGVLVVVQVTSDGNMKLVRNGLNYARVPYPVQPLMHQFNSQILSSLQALTFPLPGKQVPYGHTWEFPTDLFVNAGSRSEGALFAMKFKYVGVRTRGGRTEAVVEIAGSLKGDPNAKGVETSDAKDDPQPADNPTGTPEPQGSRFQDTPPAAKKGRKGLYGVARGYAYIDVTGGFVAEVKLYIDLDIEATTKDPVTKQDVPVDAGGTMELLLRRRTAETAK